MCVEQTLLTSSRGCHYVCLALPTVEVLPYLLSSFWIDALCYFILVRYSGSLMGHRCHSQAPSIWDGSGERSHYFSALVDNHSILPPE
jgi:hypothetical protein